MRGVAVVLSGFPRRSETFALGELTALAERGALHAVFTTKDGDGLSPHEDAARLAHLVCPLPAGDAAAQAAHVAAILGDKRPLGIHGYFAHHPTHVAQLAAAALKVPFSFSAHAKDARKVSPAELQRRARGAAAVITCNMDTYAMLDRLGAAAHLVPHGVNLDRFAAGPWHYGEPLQLLVVARLVPKKGLDVLLHALPCVRTPCTLRVVGDGPERPRLERLALELELATRIHWHGTATHTELPALYQGAHAVIVPSIVDDEGDRDGLPNVVLEALATARPVIATRVGAIQSAIEDGRTGWLVEPNDPVALARRIDRLADAGHEAAAMATRGRLLVETRFELRRCASRFADTLAGCYA